MSQRSFPVSERLVGCCLVLGCFVFCTPGWAQSGASRGDVFGTYNYTPNSFSYLGGGESGWSAGFDAKAIRWLSISGEVGQSYGSFTCTGCNTDHWNTTTFLFGPRVFLPLSKAARITPFGHFLFGGIHESYSYGFPCSGCTSPFQNPTSFAWMLGGGLDYRVSGHFSLRAEGDYLHTHVVTSDNQLQNQIQNGHPRLAVGGVFRF